MVTGIRVVVYINRIGVAKGDRALNWDQKGEVKGWPGGSWRKGVDWRRRNYDVAEIEVRLARRDAYDDVCNAP